MKKKEFIIICMLVLSLATFSIAQVTGNIPEEPYFEHIMIDSSNNVLLRISYNGAKPFQVIQFDSNGNFIKERTDIEALPGGPDFIDAQGNYWAAQPADEKTTTPIFKLDKDNNKTTVAEVKGFTRYFVTPKGTLFFMRANDEKAEFFQYNFGTKKEEKLFTIADIKSKNDPNECVAAEKKPELNFVVDSTGSSIALLISRKHTGEVRIYTSQGKLITQWNVVPDPLTPDSFIKDIFVDAGDLLYITHSSLNTEELRQVMLKAHSGAHINWWEIEEINPEWQKGSIAQYDFKGKFSTRIKEQISAPGAVAISSKGYIYVAMLSHEAINAYDLKGVFRFRWNALPPPKNETWAQRREKEDSLKNINENSPTAVLIQAIVNGDARTRNKAIEFLATREPESLLLIMDALKKVPGFGETSAILYSPQQDSRYLMQVGEQIAKRNQDKILPIVKDAFLKEDEKGREAVAGLVARLTKSQIPEVVDVINRIERERNSMSNSAIAYVPLQEATIKFYLDRLSASQQMGRTRGAGMRHFTEHINDGFPALKSILLDPGNPLREKARAILIAGQYYERANCLDTSTYEAYYYGDDSFGMIRYPYHYLNREIPKTIQELKELAKSNDLFVHDTAVVTLALNGIAGYEKEVLDAANRSIALQGPAMVAISFIAEHDKSRIKPLIPEMLTLLDTTIHALYPMDKETIDSLKTKYGYVAFRNASLANRNFEKMAKLFVDLNEPEIDKKLIHYVEEPKLPDAAKIAILNALNKDALAEHAPDMIRLLDHELTPQVLKQVVIDLATYKASIASDKLKELYGNYKDKQDFASYQKYKPRLAGESTQPSEKRLLNIISICELQLEIIKAMGAFGDKANLSFLVRIFNEVPDCDFRLTVMQTIARIGSNEATAPFLQAALNDEHINFYAAIALAQMGDASVLPVLIYGMLTLNDANEYATPSVFASLKEPGINELLLLLDSPYQSIATHAAFLLGSLKVQRAKSKIIALYNNKDKSFDYEIEGEILDALLLLGEDPFPAYFSRHEMNFSYPVGAAILGIKEKVLAVNALEHYLRPGAKTDDVLNALTCLSLLKIPESRTALEKYIPPDNQDIKQAHSLALLCN